MADHSLLFRKRLDGRVYSSSQWGIVVLDFPGQEDFEVKDYSGPVNWHTDGNFAPEVDMPRFKAYDIKVRVGYKGDTGTATSAIIGFTDVMSGRSGDSGIVFDMMDSLTGRTFSCVRLKGFSSDSETRTAHDGDIFVMDLDFRVMDPVSRPDASLFSGRLSAVPQISGFTPRADLEIGTLVGNSYVPVIGSVYTDKRIGLLEGTGVFPDIEYEEPYVNDWLCEDGEQVYNSKKAYVQEFEKEFIVGAHSIDDMRGFILTLRAACSPRVYVKDYWSGLTFRGSFLFNVSQNDWRMWSDGSQMVISGIKLKCNEYMKW